MVIPDQIGECCRSGNTPKVCTSRAIGGHQRVAYKVRMRTRVFGVCGSTSAMQEGVLFCAWCKIQIQ